MAKALSDIGAVIKKVRRDLDISLDKAAQLTGVSKAMLGQIERGDSSPTISTLWKISAGLRIPFSKLLAEDSKEYYVTELNDITPVYEDDGKVILYNIFPFNPVSGFDYFYIKLLPGCNYKSPSHANVQEEYVVVTKGTLSLYIDGKEYTLGEGASIKFKGDATHVYVNKSGQETIFQNITRY